jgi:hypothetical protein
VPRLRPAGTLIDAAFFNNTTALAGSLVHSGDAKSGRKDGFDETIRLDLNSLQDGVRCVLLPLLMMPLLLLTFMLMLWFFLFPFPTHVLSVPYQGGGGADDFWAWAVCSRLGAPSAISPHYLCMMFIPNCIG